MNHFAKWRSAVRKCVFFFVHFYDVVLVMFCDRTELLRENFVTVPHDTSRNPYG